MILLIARHRFLTNLLTTRVSLSFVLCIVLFSLSAFILAGDYSDRVEEFNSYSRSTEKNIRNIPVFSELSVTVVRPPSPLSTICEGADKRLGVSFDVAFDRAPTVAEEETVRNPLLSVFPLFDGMGVVEIILSLLVIFLAYNVISGQREQGTLKLVMSCGVPRYKILIGEYIGGMATAVLPLAMGFIVSLIILATHPAVVFTARDYLIAGMLVVLSVIYLSVFFTLSMLLSTRIRRSATILILTLVVWVVTLFILPQSAVYIARRVVHVPDKAEIDNRAQELRFEWTGEMDQYAKKHPWPVRSIMNDLGSDNTEESAIFLRRCERERNVYTGSWPYAFRYYFGPREFVKWYEDGSIYGHNLRMNYEDRIWQIYREYLSQLQRQAKVAWFLSALSPSFTFYHAAAHLSGTSEAGYISFIDAAALYRAELILYMKGKRGLDSYLLFTRKSPDAFPTAREILQLRKSRGDNAVFEMMNYPVEPLALNDLPRFTFDARNISRGFAAALPGIAVLLVMSVILFTFAWVLFLRSDVR
jgi:ABC-type transport system involved in multi-copper enzyme maturation permease subunit